MRVQEPDGRWRLTEVAEYDGEPAVRLSATQLGSSYSASRKRQIVDEWVRFFESGPTPITSLELVTRTPDRLFTALARQTQLQRLGVKWGDYEGLGALTGMSQLADLWLGGASRVRDLGPLGQLDSVRRLQVEGLRGLLDGTPVGAMRSVTDLEIGGNWQTPRNVRIASAVFLRSMPQLQHLVMHSLVVDDLDYSPLLSLPNLQTVRVMAARGMQPSIDELMDRLPWRA